ncbi:MAG: hypothetical protein JWP81_3554 [Ferruginibacter sp.]|nr:hypothetical protein [Ferruginibacter sp.]
MKEIICCFLFFFIMLTGKTQTGTAEAVNQTVFLLPEFAHGKVLFLNGTSQQVMLNYNTLFEQMIFEQNGLMMALDQINTIDTVFIDSMKFIPVDTSFYEVRLEQTRFSLYTRHSSIVTKDGTAAPFGGTTQTGAVQNLSSYRLGVATPYQLKPADNYTVNKQVTFFIKINEQLTLVKSPKQLGQLSPGNEKKIIRFIENNDIVLNKRQDLEKLLLFIETFNRKN